ncbi:chymotrypsin-1-like [Amblyomma americanum]
MQGMARIPSYSELQHRTIFGLSLAPGIFFGLLLLVLMKAPVPVDSLDVIIKLTTDPSETSTDAPTDRKKGLDTKINQAGCGIAEPLGRVLLGEPISSKRQIPWIVQLKAVVRNRYTFDCGGSIISSNVILTAAHCVSYLIGKEDAVQVIVFYNTTIEYSGVYNYAESMMPYPQYDEVNSYDVALLKLQDPLRFDAFVKPICLPMHKIQVQGKPLLAAGWGRIGIGNKSSTKLLYAELHALDDDICFEWTTRLKDAETHKKIVTGPSICVHERKSICKGDSGGPLSLLGANGKSVLVGVTSRTGGCTIGENNSALFARVSAYMTWIKSALANPDEWRPLLTDRINAWS